METAGQSLSMIGQTVSHYQILGKISSGGMGVIYRAEDNRLKRPVALKFLPAELTRDDEAKQRFIQEARAASALQQNNICTVHDIDESGDGRLFIVMDCYDGEPLKEKIARGPLAYDEAAGILSQIAGGLLKAHEKGIVHRDIKPDNIFITADGTVKILDFGLAKLAGSQTRLTRDGSMLGTAAYMSPEQARGEDVDAGTDIWSAGIVLYEMLTGRLPFKGAYDQAVLYSILHEKPAPVRSFRPDTPDTLRLLAERCLEKDKRDRPQSMQELIRVLKTDRAPSPTPFTSLRRPQVLKIGASALLFLAVLAAFLFRGRIPSFNRTGPGECRIGMLPFADMTRQEDASWPLLIQAMMVDHLTGLEEIRVVDPFSLNGLLKNALPDARMASGPDLYRIVRRLDIGYLVEGMINRAGAGFTLQCTLTDPVRGEVKFSSLGRFSGEDDLPAAVQDLSRDILDFFHIRTLVSEKENDLRPWFMNRTKNLAALKAFLQASEFSYAMRPGGERYLREAIRLDSSFLAPRIWLLSTLIETQKFEEARRQHQILIGLEENANPFERALIRWTGASLRQDLREQEQALEEALHFSLGNNILLYLLGRIRFLHDDYRGAIDAIQPAVDMKWPFQPAYYLLGISYAEDGECRKAITVLEQSLGLESVYPATYSVLAVLSLQNHDPDQFYRYADTYIREETAAGKPLDLLYHTLGMNCSRLGLYGNAVVYDRRAVSLRPGHAPYHFSLGYNLFHGGSIDSARTELFLALEKDSSLFDAHRLLGLIFEHGNDMGKARRHYLHFLLHDSTSAEALDIQNRLDRFGASGQSE
ncbi:protein kinase [bacterium]|nr:protein kinase [bacterium]